MELTKEQFDNLKGYICNINFDHELYGAETALRLIGFDDTQLELLFSAKKAELKERKHFNKGNKKKHKYYQKRMAKNV